MRSGPNDPLPALLDPTPSSVTRAAPAWRTDADGMSIFDLAQHRYWSATTVPLTFVNAEPHPSKLSMQNDRGTNADQ
jgi:hypothetical protein